MSTQQVSCGLRLVFKCSWVAQSCSKDLFWREGGGALQRYNCFLGMSALTFWRQGHKLTGHDLDHSCTVSFENSSALPPRFAPLCGICYCTFSWSNPFIRTTLSPSLGTAISEEIFDRAYHVLHYWLWREDNTKVGVDIYRITLLEAYDRNNDIPPA